MPEPSRAFDLLVFDWDGTLSDSLPLIVDAMSAAIADAGLEPRDGARIRDCIGLGLEEVARRLYPGLPDSGVQQLAGSYRARWREVPPASVPLVPGAAETLAALHAAGYSIAIATGKGRRGLDQALAHSGIGHFIHASRCADEAPSKPHPQMLHDLMDVFSVPPRRTLMIGDSEHDLLMARNAGTPSAALTPAGRDPGPLLEFEPLVCLPGFPELRSWLAESDGWTRNT
jgi:phosphoglycolate phosphatase